MRDHSSFHSTAPPVPPALILPARLFTLAIGLIALLAPGIMAAPVSAPPSAGSLTAETVPMSTEPSWPASVPCSDSGIASHGPLAPPAANPTTPEQDDEEEDGGGSVVSCDVGATVDVSEGTERRRRARDADQDMSERGSHCHLRDGRPVF